MPRTKLIAAVWVAGLLAGCGGGSKTPTIPSGNASTNGSVAGEGALSHTGPVGTMGATGSGGLNATNPDVLRQIDSRLVTYYTAKGFTGVTAICKGTNATSASCRITGTSSAGQTSSAVVTLALNQATGLLKVTHVAP